jgi:hypothetical protein
LFSLDECQIADALFEAGMDPEKSLLLLSAGGITVSALSAALLCERPLLSGSMSDRRWLQRKRSGCMQERVHRIASGHFLQSIAKRNVDA